MLASSEAAQVVLIQPISISLLRLVSMNISVVSSTKKSCLITKTTKKWKYNQYKCWHNSLIRLIIEARWQATMVPRNLPRQQYPTQQKIFSFSLDGQRESGPGRYVTGPAALEQLWLRSLHPAHCNTLTQAVKEQMATVEATKTLWLLSQEFSLLQVVPHTT